MAWWLFLAICSLLQLQQCFGKAVVFLQEMCGQDGELYTYESFQEYLRDAGKRLPEVPYVFLDKEEVCTEKFPSTLMEAAWSQEVFTIIGSMDDASCEIVTKVAGYKHKQILSWSCPQFSRYRLIPSIQEVVAATTRTMSTFKVKSALLLYSELGLWTRLVSEIEVGLSETDTSVRRLFLHKTTWNRSFNALKSLIPKVVIVCASSKARKKILKSMDANSIYPSMVLLLEIYHSTITDVQPYLTHADSERSVRHAREKHLLEHPSATVSSQSEPTFKTSKEMFTFQEGRSKKSETISRRDKVSKTQTMFNFFPNAINNNNNRTVSYAKENELEGFNNTRSVDLDVSSEDGLDKWKINKRISQNKYVVALRDEELINQSVYRENKTEWVETRDKEDNIKAEYTPSVMEFETTPMTIKNDSIRQKMFNKTKLWSGSLLDRVVNLRSARTPREKFVKKLVPENFKYKRRKREGGRKKTSELDFVSNALRENILIMSINSVEASVDERSYVFDKLYEAFNVIEATNLTNSSFTFSIYDRVYESSDVNLLRIRSLTNKWRLIMSVESRIHDSDARHISLNITKRLPHFSNWLIEKLPGGGEEDYTMRPFEIKMNLLGFSAVIAVSLIVFTFCVAAIAFIRNLMMKRRQTKRSNKVVLFAGDFVFPQITDGRRVEEGMEAMLCCWLQQLQEFGGPEVEKPDLLKGSTGSLKGLGATMNTANGTKGPSSNGSIVKSNFLLDTRTRYNGDLVQMKYFPFFGNFELKRKANDVLLVMQGLRHENLNPFIGCLCEPSKPALVFEYCSRGSLEDVLVADDIKLDWTFRLSLLTDLVRGMRYLHTTALRAHGFLTSRNCVVDSRWVLKVTDYGLPSFYRAQGVVPPPKTSRDLLWTAPELLRDMDSSGLCNMVATQPGDVYSFAIVMQEVVVRGEPFCMLSLSPHEIIEKVKRPPPLIRPSVSKGAAPPEAINIMRQCWTEQAEMRPDFNAVHDLFRKLNHGRKVNFIDTMFQMLEKYSNNLEELIKERTEQLDIEKKKTEQLLARMLPSYVAEKLKLGMPVDPEEFSEVSIYFSDIVGFTAISAHSSPFQVVDLLNDLYTCFDATINAYNVYKVETIGDAYMVVGGLPVRTPDHAEQIATMALDLLHQAGRFKIRHLPRTPLRLRIGLHTGPCCAGVVGLTMPRYCLFGDTVNTASRMESTGAAFRIHLSQATRDKLEAAGGYYIDYRGLTDIKGKGRMHTYWLLGKAGFEKALPMPPPIEESHGLEESLIIEKDMQSLSNSLLHKSDESGETSPRPPQTLSPRVIHSLSADEKMPFIDSDRSSEKMNSERSSSIERSPLFPHRDSEVTAQQVVEMRKLNFALTLDMTHKHYDVYQRKIEPRTCSIVSSAPATDMRVEQSDSFSNGDVRSDGATPSKPDEKLVTEAAALLLSARPREPFRLKRNSIVEENDLSSAYNHYKILSPSDSHLNQYSKAFSLTLDRPNTGRLLKRQFSLDKHDDYNPGRLYKQNSAGAANDLEKIEEIPVRRLSRMEPCGSTSVSAESLHQSRNWSDGGR